MMVHLRAQWRAHLSRLRHPLQVFIAPALVLAALWPATVLAQQVPVAADPVAPAHPTPARDPEPEATARPTLAHPAIPATRPTEAPTERPAIVATPAQFGPGIPPLPVKPILPIAPPPPLPTATPAVLPVAQPTVLPTAAPITSPANLPDASLAAGPAAPASPTQTTTDSALVAAAAGAPAPIELEKVVYLTFDDGPSPWTSQILDVLAEYEAHATFFVVGRQAAALPDTIRRMYDEGHGVGSHSWSHTSMRGMGWESFKWEVETTAGALGEYESKCLRPPYGHTDGNTANFTQDMGYTLALWNVDPADWRVPGGEVIANRVLAVVQPASVVLLHDGGGDRSQTVAALRIILERLKADGYSFKALCREADVPVINGTPKPDNILPVPAGVPDVYPTPAGTVAPVPPPPADAAIAAAAADSENSEDSEDSEGGKVVALETPPTPAPNTQGAVVLPQAGALVSGIQPVIGYANSATFVKWQLDLLVNNTEEVFLALGEAPIEGPSPLFTWDTTLYPNGVHMLRLRVVYAGSNYDEYFAHVTVQN